METTTLDFNTITLMVMIAGSWLTLVGLIVFQYSRLDAKIDSRIGTLDTKIDNRFEALDAKFDKKFDALGGDVADIRERLGRVEGHLMGPESFTSGPPSPDEPAGDHRQAG